MPRKPYVDKRQMGFFDAPAVEELPTVKLKTGQEQPVFNSHYWVMAESGVCYCDTSRMDIAMELGYEHSMAQKNPIFICMGPGTERAVLGRYFRGDWTTADTSMPEVI